jgi:hypothetical protein
VSMDADRSRLRTLHARVLAVGEGAHESEVGQGLLLRVRREEAVIKIAFVESCRTTCHFKPTLKARRFIKRQMSKARRRNGRCLLDDAPTRCTRGWWD